MKKRILITPKKFLFPKKTFLRLGKSHNIWTQLTFFWRCLRNFQSFKSSFSLYGSFLYLKLFFSRSLNCDTASMLWQRPFTSRRKYMGKEKVFVRNRRIFRLCFSFLENSAGSFPLSFNKKVIHLAEIILLMAQSDIILWKTCWRKRKSSILMNQKGMSHGKSPEVLLTKAIKKVWKVKGTFEVF